MTTWDELEASYDQLARQGTDPQLLVLSLDAALELGVEHGQRIPMRSGARVTVCAQALVLPREVWM